MRSITSNGVLSVQGDPSAQRALKNVQSICFLIHLHCTNFCTGTMVVPVYRWYGTISKCATLGWGIPHDLNISEQLPF